MNRLILITSFLVCLFVTKEIDAQINIISIPVQPFNLTPEALLNVNIMNNEAEKSVQLVTQLYSSNNTILLTVRSKIFQLKRGLNAGISGVASFEFSNISQASYLKTTHNLASGRYRVCGTLLIAGGADRIDEFCGIRYKSWGVI